jgi:DNA invertase Pin-like site-specific DNA recombinase
MIYGYCRVSTDKQTVENQQFEINRFASENNIKIDRWITETVSSNKNLDRRELGKLLKNLESGNIVITTEISRLGRNLLQIMGILHDCMEKNCQIWSVKENYRLGADLQSKILAFAFGISAEIERQLISSRVKEALARRKAEGKTLGRPVGSRGKKLKLTGKDRRIRALLSDKVPKVQIARMLNVDVGTLYRFIKDRPDLPLG